MSTDPISAIGSVASAVAEGEKLATQRSALNNAPAMQANAAAKTASAIAAEIAAAEAEALAGSISVAQKLAAE